MVSSFEGMEGMEGMVGNAANAGGTGANSTGDWFFADRVDLPFVTEEFAPGQGVKDENIDIGLFPDRNWTATWHPWLVMSEFAKTGWDTLNIRPAWVPALPVAPTSIWNSTAIQPGFTQSTFAMVQDELDGLVTSAQIERANVLGEIVGQKDEFISYFLNLATAANGYPATAKVLAIASFIGAFTSLYYKGQYKRPRPSMLRPALMPPIVVPGHASFPSGHATQAHLMALCMEDVLAGKPHLAAVKNNMKALAVRIARNREIAGLHYPSDSEAGMDLAVQIKPLLQGLPAGGWYQQAISDAKLEWPS